jgi:tRNA(Ile)-lysidine synthase
VQDTDVTDGPRKTPLLVHRAARTVADALRRHDVHDQSVLVAVSGGSDSTALLLLAARAATSLRLTLHVGCIDHRVRADSAREVELVRELARRFGAPLHTESIDAGGDDEDSLRRARLDALARIADRTGCRFVLLGHTADDQIETIVFRFVRGAGFGGLAGMRERRDRFVRPLLTVRREELRRILVHEGLGWVEDATNDSDRYARGRLRRGVLPAVEAAFGEGSLDHLLDVAPRWRADEDLLEREAARLLAYASRSGRAGVEIDLEALRTGDPALRSRALRRWVREASGRTLESRQLGAVERWLESLEARENEGRRSVDLPGLTVEHERGRLLLSSTGVGTAASGEVDTAASSDDAFAATSRSSEDSTVSRQEAVLPPSGGRVRVRRK